MKVIRQYADDADFREALDKAPPGIIDARSWAYWNSKDGPVSGAAFAFAQFRPVFCHRSSWLI